MSEAELKQAKQRMDRLFDQNRKQYGDPDFVYDVQVSPHVLCDGVLVGWKYEGCLAYAAHLTPNSSLH